MNAICVSMPGSAKFAVQLAKALAASHASLDIHRFPDAETRIRLESDCSGKNVVIVDNGRDPNGNALPLYFATHAAKAMGASSVGLVTPYLPYMRQDAQFREGEAVSALAYARYLSGCVDWIATVDPHLHRIQALEEIFAIPAVCATSMPSISRWIGANVIRPIIIGPDSESGQWVKPVATALDVPWATLKKQRTGDRQVAVSLPEAGILDGRSPVIVDDIASSGRTLAEAAMALRSLGSLPVTCVVVHALLDVAAESELRAAGVAQLISTNTIEHSSNGIDIVPVLAQQVRTVLQGTTGNA